MMIRGFNKWNKYSDTQQNTATYVSLTSTGNLPIYYQSLLEIHSTQNMSRPDHLEFETRYFTSHEEKRLTLRKNKYEACNVKSVSIYIRLEL